MKYKPLGVWPTVPDIESPFRPRLATAPGEIKYLKIKNVSNCKVAIHNRINEILIY